MSDAAEKEKSLTVPSAPLSNTPSESGEDQETKRKKKLELNRVASRESRKRKKRRLEELQRSVLFLTHENHQLREQNELLRQMLVGRLPGAPTQAIQQGTSDVSNPAALLSSLGLPAQLLQAQALVQQATGGDH